MGARDYRFDIDTGIGTLLPNPEEALNIAAVDAAVEAAGFQLLWLELELRGTLHEAQAAIDDVHLTLTVDGTEQAFLVIPGDTEEEQRGYAQLSPWVDQADRQVILRGRAHAHSSTLPAITVRDYRVP